MCRTLKMYVNLLQLIDLKILKLFIFIQMMRWSSFISYSATQMALGLNPSSNTCNRYIDTNRLYKNKYIFTSKPINRASKG